MDAPSLRALAIILEHEVGSLPEARAENARLRAEIRELKEDKEELTEICRALRLRVLSLLETIAALLPGFTWPSPAFV